ncbi:hypothetical protein EYF80_046023 [Liparis tanakae]|uniref:Uncharacterized protein n=1 Tax=Liparis tanakae TaxID=230148 RepID=A0A4Z2FRB7_9TELE|nr:hypothetical protein EYF80_046023 [Liparis tanakae]
MPRADMPVYASVDAAGHRLLACSSHGSRPGLDVVWTGCPDQPALVLWALPPVQSSADGPGLEREKRERREGEEREKRGRREGEEREWVYGRHYMVDVSFHDILLGFVLGFYGSGSGVGRSRSVHQLLLQFLKPLQSASPPLAARLWTQGRLCRCPDYSKQEMPRSRCNFSVSAGVFTSSIIEVHAVLRDH